jgi:hypothetical protein
MSLIHCNKFGLFQSFRRTTVIIIRAIIISETFKYTATITWNFQPIPYLIVWYLFNNSFVTLFTAWQRVLFTGFINTFYTMQVIKTSSTTRFVKYTLILNLIWHAFYKEPETVLIKIKYQWLIRVCLKLHNILRFYFVQGLREWYEYITSVE